MALRLLFIVYTKILIFLFFLTALPKSFAFDESFLFFQSEKTIKAGSTLPVKLTKAPFSVNIITEKEIKASGFHKIYDILRFQPGITFFQAASSEASLGMRGTSNFFVK